MSGPAPKAAGQRRRRNKPAREWKPTPGVGWQYSPLPDPPEGLMPASIAAWKTWFASWFAWHWSLYDLPGLRQLVKLYDVVERGGAKAADRGQLIRWMKDYGITPSGQAALRWAPYRAPEANTTADERPEEKPSPYAHLRVVNS